MRKASFGLFVVVILGHLPITRCGQQAPFLVPGPLYDAKRVASLEHIQEHRLLKFANGSELWMSEAQKHGTWARGERFFDITEARDLHLTKFKQAKVSYPPLKFRDTVRAVMGRLTTDYIRDNLQTFTTKFVTRHYLTLSGVESQQWLYLLIKETIEKACGEFPSYMTLQEFGHTWPQSSIILRIKGTSLPEELVIIGSHLDSASRLGPLMPAPGAEDDGSGTMAILETLRVLAAAGFRPRRTVEFHWYAAEEGGLLGSQDVVKSYKANNAHVYAMTQVDMAAWVQKGTEEVIGIITDLTNDATSEYLRTLIDTYLDIPHVNIECGYGCSDHASWHAAGYPSSSPAVSRKENITPYAHTDKDRIDISPEFSFTHILKFSKLVVGFAVELGEWSDEGEDF